MVYRLFKAGPDDVGLFELRSYEVGVCARLAIGVDHILGDAAGQKALSALAAHDVEHLAVLPDPVLVHQAEDRGDLRLLPGLQFHQLRAELSLRVVSEVFDEAQRVVCLLLVKKIDLVLKVLDKPFVKQPDPFADGHAPVLNLLIVRQQPVVTVHR